MTYKSHIYLSLIITLALAVPISALAQGLVQVPPPTGVASGGLIPTVVNIVDILLTLVGLVAVIMIIWGGFRFIISGGDEEAAGAAKNTILFAIIGLIIIGLSAAIVNFVVGVLGTV